jgi:hypothetical protein
MKDLLPVTILYIGTGIWFIQRFLEKTLVHNDKIQYTNLPVGRLDSLLEIKYAKDVFNFYRDSKPALPERPEAR